MILDTTVLHDVMYGEPGAVRTIRTLEARNVVSKLSSMSVYELYYGVGYTDRSEEERAKVEAVLGPKPILAATERIMRRAGTLEGRLERDGEKTGQSDLIIAATGLVRDEPVLTRNVTDFERVPGLAVRSY